MTLKFLILVSITAFIVNYLNPFEFLSFAYFAYLLISSIGGGLLMGLNKDRIIKFLGIK